MPERALELYGSAITAVQRAAEREARAAIPPDSVARAVAHALTAPSPKTRCFVGTKVQVAIARLLPDRICDGLILGHMGLK